MVHSLTPYIAVCGENQFSKGNSIAAWNFGQKFLILGLYQETCVGPVPLLLKSKVKLLLTAVG